MQNNVSLCCSKTRTILLTPNPSMPQAIISINVPDSYDAEEYIDMYLDSILNEDIRYNVEWEFIEERRKTPGFSHGECQFDTTTGWYDSTITHWMPLPEPPEGENNE